MDSVDLKCLTRKQLVALAKRAGIPKYSRLTKPQLCSALLSAAPAEWSDLPARYGRTTLILMEIEPYWVYAYWEITPLDTRTALDEIRLHDSNPCWSLRFYDITNAGTPKIEGIDFFDIPIELAPGNWYVNLWSAGKSYFAEIGLRSKTGRFLSVGRSNTVHLPSTGPAPESDSAGQIVEERLDRVEEPIESVPPEILQAATPGREEVPPSNSTEPAPSPGAISEAGISVIPPPYSPQNPPDFSSRGAAASEQVGSQAVGSSFSSPCSVCTQAEQTD